MYVTRPLSRYKKFPSELSLPPPEGPNSGILVILDEEAEATCCFGSCKTHEIKDLPFPQNKNLTLRYSTGVGKNEDTSHFYAALIPVVNHPLSSNRYYAVKTRGSHKGEAYANSKEEDKGSCFCFSYVRDVPPKPLDPNDADQQFEIFRKRGGFVAKSLSLDGFPPTFLGREGWNVSTSTPRDFHLGDAPGLDNALRARLPDFNFPLSHKSCQPVVVGKWYSPFMFVREGALKNQMRRSMYYEITLEQRWERMFACEHDNESQGNGVAVDAVVQREVVSVAGREAADVNVVDGVMWFRSFSEKGEEMSAGLSLLVVERMKWEQERVGWVGGEEKQVTLKRVEEFGGNEGWRNFGFYVLVERFVVKRMDGSLVLTYDFNHIQQSRGKWE
ncbi:uncharacterized protein LOC132179537 [Corylus avellana]|uniref:uncharacterized protein LOC132179492 n=1 Tax=Corylus avellana TaxID=13451 RepID=UPI001E2186D5|nr:uncharacterized protein LOC132179492 [Corylus avellana]XP_059448253.1 uncharacterized protein LOC132179537 [Corylus avellana]